MEQGDSGNIVRQYKGESWSSTFMATWLLLSGRWHCDLFCIVFMLSWFLTASVFSQLLLPLTSGCRAPHSADSTCCGFVLPAFFCFSSHCSICYSLSTSSSYSCDRESDWLRSHLGARQKHCQSMDWLLNSGGCGWGSFMEILVGELDIIIDMSSVFIKLVNTFFTKLVFIHYKPCSLPSVAVLYPHFINKIFPII